MRGACPLGAAAERQAYTPQGPSHGGRSGTTEGKYVTRRRPGAPRRRQRGKERAAHVAIKRAEVVYDAPAVVRVEMESRRHNARQQAENITAHRSTGRWQNANQAG